MFQITKPTLLLDQSICKANIKKMAAMANRNNVALVPHFKTHQSARVGEWFREEGVKAITVTSLKMAKYFASHGWNDITIAFPVNVLEINDLDELASRVDLKIFVNSVMAVEILKNQLKNPVQFYIEINVGDDRSGLDYKNFSKISEILETAGNCVLNFEGFYTHAGHTYNAGSPGEVRETYQSVMKKFQTLKEHFKAEYPDLKLSMGDTPSCSIINDFNGLDSIHPGNFVYYDLVQHGLGANELEEIAICLAVPVVSLHPERQEVIVHSGWVHQGKDALVDATGKTHFGLVVKLTANKWTAPVKGACVVKLSQEHGVLSLPKEMMSEIKIGDVLGILPVHACATAVMMGEVVTLEGEKLAMMPR